MMGNARSAARTFSLCESDPMKTYLTLIQIAGLRRDDVARAREPIGEGEVISLPDGFARSLLNSGAIEPSDAPVTVPLHWDAPVNTIRADDLEGLKKALEIHGIDLASGPDRSGVQVAGIAPTDVEALAQALEAAGALVVLRGEQLAGMDHARLDKLLADEGVSAVLTSRLHTPKLLAELAQRIGEGEIELAQMPEEVMGLVAPAFATAIASGTPEATEEAKPAAKADAKPARKRG